MANLSANNDLTGKLNASGTVVASMIAQRGPKGNTGDKGEKGDTGNSLEYNWNGTSLGVRVEGETNYTYTNLKGDKGDKGDSIKGDTGEKGDKGDTGAVKIIAVQELPTENIDTTAIYIVPAEEPTEDNQYAEYIYVNDEWEPFGSGTTTSVDLTNYVKFTDYANNNNGGVVKTNSYYGTKMDNGILEGYTKDYNGYSTNLSSSGLISKGTLENVITGKELTNKTYVNAADEENHKDIETVKSNVFEVGTASGSNISVTDATSNKMIDLSIDGVCKQETTSGYQLLSNNYASGSEITHNGITFKVLEDGRTSVKGTATGSDTNKAKFYFINYTTNDLDSSLIGETITIQTNSNFPNGVRIETFNNSWGALLGGYSLSNNTKHNTGILGSNKMYVYVSVDPGVTVDTIVDLTIYKGEYDANKKYEPYTAGASPNPSYPQEISTIDDEFDAIVCGNNILDLEKVLEERIESRLITVQNGKAILNGTFDYSNWDFYITFSPGTYRGYSNKNKLHIIGASGDGYFNGWNETLTEETTYRCYFEVGTYNNEEFEIMISKGNQQIAFEPYKEQTIAIDPGTEFIGAIGNVKDYVKLEYNTTDRKYHKILHKNIYKYTFTGNENWGIVSGNRFNCNFSSLSIPNAIDSYDNVNCICNKLIGSSLGSLSSKTNSTSCNAANMYIRLNETTTINDIRTFLSNGDVEVYYILATPYTVDLGTVDIPSTYIGTTNVFTDSELEPTVNIKYYKELNYITPSEMNTSLSNYVPKTGGDYTGKITAPKIETGTDANNYFQSRKFRGEGEADSYYHAVDFGYAQHDQVDFYEYGGAWNFWKNTTKAATNASANKCLGITQNSLINKNFVYTWPNKTGTFALTSDLADKAKVDGLANIKSVGTGLELNSSTGELTATGEESHDITYKAPTYDYLYNDTSSNVYGAIKDVISEYSKGNEKEIDIYFPQEYAANGIYKLAVRRTILNTDYVQIDIGGVIEGWNDYNDGMKSSFGMRVYYSINRWTKTVYVKRSEYDSNNILNLYTNTGCTSEATSLQPDRQNNGFTFNTPGPLGMNNEVEWTPTGDYNPATKKYVDDNLPTSGSNDNGSWVKYPDGTMICYLNISVTDQAINTAYGNLFIGNRLWTFPQTFIETPSVSCGLFHWGSSASWGGTYSPTVNQVNLRGFDALSRATGTSCRIQAIAIGKWK